MKFSPMIRSTPIVRELFPQRANDQLATILYRERKDGLARLLITGANSPRQLEPSDDRRTGPRRRQQVRSQRDGRSRADGGQPVARHRRRQDFQDQHAADDARLPHHAQLPGRLARASLLPCPHCGVQQILEWDNLLANLDPAKPDDAHFTCVACGCVIEESDRPRCSPAFSGAPITLPPPKSIAAFGFGAHTATCRPGRRSRANG